MEIEIHTIVSQEFEKLDLVQCLHSRMVHIREIHEGVTLWILLFTDILVSIEIEFPAD